MNFRLFSALAAAALLSARPASADPGDFSPARPAIPARSFNLADFGAVADGRTVNTAAFQRAIDAVRQAGGGVLIVPAGVFLTGPLELCDRIDLHLSAGATLLFSSNAADYNLTGKPLQPQIAATGRHDVMISGPGVINGNGDAWWPAARAMRDGASGKQLNGHTTPRPPMVVFNQCRNIRVAGVTLTHSPELNLGINRSHDATVENLTIFNPPDSPNTDGIDPKGASRVLISHCRIDTGDDCIAIGNSREAADERDILVTDCAFFHGHGCSIGSWTKGSVRNFTVRRCTFDGTATGIRLKSARDRGGLVENLLYTDITMKNVGRAISLNSHYEGTTTDATDIHQHIAPEPVTATTPQWRNVVIRNVTAAATLEAGIIQGLPEMPAEAITLENVRIAAPTGLQVGYAKNITLKNVSISAAAGPPLVTAGTVQNLSE
jgi:polygalacturonase